MPSPDIQTYTTWRHPDAPARPRLRWQIGLAQALWTLVAALPERPLIAFATWLLRDVIGYRRRVIADNLARSFPTASPDRRRRIARAYYRHLAAVFVESLHLIRLTPQQLRQRITVTGAEVFAQYAAQGRNVIIISAHQGNWEFSGPRMALEPLGMTLYGVYRRLANVPMDAMLHRARSRTGMQMVEYDNTFRALMAAQSVGRWAFALVGDQNAHANQGSHWVWFLHQPTAFFTGPAKLAQRFNAPMVWVRSFRQARGRYAVTCTVFEDQPAAHTTEALTERFARELEADIHRHPEQWLWSHKRWKHAPPPDFAPPNTAATGTEHPAAA